MKFSIVPVAALMAATSSSVVLADDWKCNGVWGDGGLRRYSFRFKGYCENRWGQCFLDNIRGKGLTVHNWQCWKTDDDGWWQADFSTTAGLAWQINNAIEVVTGSWRGCWPNHELQLSSVAYLPFDGLPSPRGRLVQILNMNIPMREIQHRKTIESPFAENKHCAMYVHENCCADAKPLEIWLQGQDGKPQKFEQQLSLLDLDQRQECFALIFMNANEVSKCETCRSTLEKQFSIPKFWFELYCRRSNGYFGSQDIASAGIMTWARFLIKFVEENDEYKWLKFNIMTYAPSAKSQIMLVFDAVDPTKELLLRCLMDGPQDQEMADDLFWVYYRILSDVTSLFDKSIWGLRTVVRKIESIKVDTDNIDRSYRKLHDLARHAIHITETTATTLSTVERICAAHGQYADEDGQSTLTKSTRKRVQDHFLLQRQIVLGLQNRALATKDRLHNEIQLSFNTVVKNDSGVMKTIARLTLLFLPATFVSAIFSMSFFNFSPERDLWTVSHMFWVYWVVAAPLTVMAFFSFQFRGLNSESGLVSNNEASTKKVEGDSVKG
ncbi:Mg2+ transporter protein, CorA-like/Zinc transport protein ZntB [Cordyceps fumosorosea ARSEF 2679]|uniref:Mg2+ transporter protein, CorA-like/Zinc transport protein ZntB n=1 Tax=Cordyceps fumosorosea (strain ARSEF 2679) TaxID=1081104 RepID=A0A162M9Z9_CORFA|nr:Mg2+ transporter protein, CorA-like/Zinc transport protein ZntB [Cordyceps fumosorosea ARSEF 2679]OAA53160.1 Mg2+ transporter protein, CorA-like/Zinc transport protein ZntB [Cordyceps fumosorosea ARSEF 2679]